MYVCMYVCMYVYKKPQENVGGTGEVLYVDEGGAIEGLSWERLNHRTGGAVFGTLTRAQIQ